MEDLEVVLETLINRATDTGNGTTDTAPVIEFCNMINKEPHCAHIAAKVIAIKIQSSQEWEALQGLNLLDNCMKQCGSIFHAEVGKFRFLNEMIKLVSPKYLGNRTTPAVRRKVLHMMYTWTIDYSRETKIKEAYEMLKKQGVIKDEPIYISSEPDTCLPSLPPRSKNTIFEDDERSRLLQKLLQSKSPDDIQAANRLIKTMVKEDERRVEVNSRRITELESVHNNARLLSEMLDSYRPEQSSREELELIKELHQSCERLRPNVFRLASETQDNDAMLNEVLSASDELGQVFDKYTSVIILGKNLEAPLKSGAITSLLDLSTPIEENLPPVPLPLVESKLSDVDFNLASSVMHENKSNISSIVSSPVKLQSNYDVLGDIFASIEPTNISSLLASPHSILQPVSIQQQSNTNSTLTGFPDIPEKSSKMKALDDLDSLGESMLMQSLPISCKLGSQFAKSVTKVPMNLMGKMIDTNSPTHVKVESSSSKTVSTFDLDFLIGGAVKAAVASSISDSHNGDDSMVDLTEEIAEVSIESVVRTELVHRVTEELPKLPSIKTDNDVKLPVDKKSNVLESNSKNIKKEVDLQSSSIVNSPEKQIEVKPLTDVFVSLDSIKPGSLPPLTVLEERNGITVILHFAKDSPRSDVSVMVVTTISKNSSTLTNYLFQAVVPKTCKLRLQPPSSTELPAHSPFLPPSAITQVILLANPSKDPQVSLKFILSYTMDDETMTEMGEVEQLPLIL